MKSKIYVLFLLSLASGAALADVFEFKDPRVEGLRMDRCLSWGQECDEPAAYSWCLEKGYAKAIYWEIQSNVGKAQPTKMLKSKEICNKERCDAFKTIVCYKNA